MISAESKTEIVNVRRVALKPIEDKKETIIDRLMEITEHPKLELIRIGILAGIKDDYLEIKKYGVVKVKEATTKSSPRTTYCICKVPKKIKGRRKFVWTTLEDLLDGLEKSMNDPENEKLRFYVDYLLVLDKGYPPNNAYVIVEMRKYDSVSPESPFGVMLYPEHEPLDVIMLYSINLDTNWIPEDKGGYWKVHKSNKIHSEDNPILLNYRNFSFVDAKWVRQHTRNFYNNDAFVVRGCDALKSLKLRPVYDPLPDGACYLVDKDKLTNNN